MLECTDTSAPSASGCWRNGVANVLSTTTRACVGELGDRLDVDDRERRVGRRLDPHESRLVAPRGLERGGVAQIDRRPRHAVTLVHARDEPERPAVRVGGDDHVVAGIERAQDRVLGRETARERETVARVLQRRDARLERGARRVGAARVLVAPVLADRVLRERRGQADRRHDRARRRVGLLPRVNRASRTPSVLMRLRPPALIGPSDPGPRICAWLMSSSGRRGTRARRSG